MTRDELAERLKRGSGTAVTAELAEQLLRYLTLLERWNARTNLSAIRDAGQIVDRHFGESLQCARLLPVGIATLLDYGSGAGFPGAVIALARPEIAVTLAESQGKKAAFLQELARTLAIEVCVHADRVEALPPQRKFSAVTLRAVDRMTEACREARGRVEPGGWLVAMTTQAGFRAIGLALDGVAWRPGVPIAGGEQGIVAVGRVLASHSSS